MRDGQSSSPILLYDGVCGFCNTSVQMILRHDRRRTMRFAALQSGYGEAVRTRHPELRDVDSVVLVEQASDTGEERVFIRSNAAPSVDTSNPAIRGRFKTGHSGGRSSRGCCSAFGDERASREFSGGPR